MKILRRACIIITFIVALISSGETRAQEWSSPLNLSDPGQSVGAAKSVSNAAGDSITLWWDLGEKSIISTRLSSAGSRTDTRVATSRPDPISAHFEMAADASMSKIVAVYPQTAASGLTLQFVRSDDGGASWSKPVRAGPRLSYFQLLVSRDFQKLIILGTFGPESSRTLQFVRSLDGGLTWSPPEVFASQSSVWYNISLSAVADERLETVVAFLGFVSQNGAGGSSSTRTLGLVSSDSGMSWNPELSLDGLAIRQAKLMPSSGQIVAVGARVTEGGGTSIRSLDVIRATGMRGEWLLPTTIEKSRRNRSVSRIVSSADGATLAFAWSSGVTDWDEHLVNVATSVDGGLSWRNSSRVSFHARTATVSAHSLHMSSDGANLTLVWGARPPSESRIELVTASSSDSGLTWADPTVHGWVESLGWEHVPLADLVIAQSGGFGRLIFVHPTALMAAVSADEGESWSVPGLLSRPVYTAGAARLLRISNLELLATWTRFRDNFDGFIETARSIDGGITWSTPEVLFDGALSDISGTYSASGGDLVIAVWNERNGNSDRALFARSLDAGETWVTSELELVPIDSLLLHVQVAADSGRAMIFFTPKNGSARAVRAILSVDSGATWSEVPLAALNSRFVDSVISSDGLVVHAAFAADDVSNLGPVIRTSRDGGLSWSVSQVVPSSSNSFSNGRFQSSIDGMRVVLLAAERQGSSYRIIARRTVNGGGTWADGLFEPIEGIDAWGRLVTAGSDDGGVVYAAWKKGSNMLSAVSEDAGASWTWPWPLFQLPSGASPSVDHGVFFQASGDGRRLVLLGSIRRDPSATGSAYVELVASFSADYGSSWGPRTVISSSANISQSSLEVTPDASSATALWIAHSEVMFGSRSRYVQVASGRELTSPIFRSGFEQ